MVRYSIYFTLIFLFHYLNGLAQFPNYPLNQRSEFLLKKQKFDSVNQQLPGFKPYVIKNLNLDEVEGYKKDTTKYYYWYTEKLFSDHLLKHESPDFDFYLDPDIELYIGKDLTDESVYTDTTTIIRNTRGIIIHGRVGERLTFETAFRESQALLPFYLFTHIRSTGVVPGQGRTKSFKRTGFDFASSSAVLSFKASDWINLQFGHGKHFIGQGYRSLLLSDHSFNYPFFRITINKGSTIEYNSVFASLQNLDRIPSTSAAENFFKRKAANFNYIEFNIVDRAKIGLFEGVIWERFNDQAGTLDPEWESFVPLIFFNSASQGLNGEANVILGANASARISRYLQAYGQVVLDDKDNRHLGWQAGLEGYVKHKFSSFFRAEYNTVDPFSFRADNTQPTIHFSHYNEPLTHPLGAGFEELIAQLGTTYKRWQLRFQYQYANFNVETELDPGFGDLGSDIFLPKPNLESDITTYNSILKSFNASLSYFFNPINNLEFFIEMNDRKLINEGLEIEKSLAISIGLRTLWSNRYYDF